MSENSVSKVEVHRWQPKYISEALRHEHKIDSLCQWEPPDEFNLLEFYELLASETNHVWQPLTNIGQIVLKNHQCFIRTKLSGRDTNYFEPYFLNNVGSDTLFETEKALKKEVNNWRKSFGKKEELNFEALRGPENETGNLARASVRLFEKLENCLKNPKLQNLYFNMSLSDGRQGDQAFIDLVGILTRLAERYSMLAVKQNQQQFGSSRGNLEKAAQLFFYLNCEDFDNSGLAQDKIIPADKTLSSYGQKVPSLAAPLARVARQNVDKARIWLKAISILLNERAKLPANWKKKEVPAQLEVNRRKLLRAYMNVATAIMVLNDIIGTAEKPVNLDAKTISAITKLNDDGIKYSGGKLVISGVSEGRIKKLLENKDIPDGDKKTINEVFLQSLNSAGYLVPSSETERSVMEKVFLDLRNNESGISYTPERIRAQLGGVLKTLAETYRIQAEIAGYSGSPEAAELKEKSRRLYGESWKYLSDVVGRGKPAPNRTRYFDYVPVTYLDWAEASLEKASGLVASGSNGEGQKIAQEVFDTFNKKFVLTDEVADELSNPNRFISEEFEENVLARIVSQVPQPKEDKSDTFTSSIIRFLRVFYRASKILDGQDGKNIEYKSVLQKFVFGNWEESVDEINKVLLGLIEGSEEAKKNFGDRIKWNFYNALVLGRARQLTNLRNTVFYEVFEPSIIKQRDLSKPFEITITISESLLRVLKSAQENEILFKKASSSGEKVSKIGLESIDPKENKYKITISSDLTWQEFILLFSHAFMLFNGDSKDNRERGGVVEDEKTVPEEFKITRAYKSINKNPKLMEFIRQHKERFDYDYGSFSVASRLMANGKMTEEEKQSLLLCFEKNEDKKTIEKLFRRSTDDLKFWTDLYRHLDEVNPLACLGLKPLIQVIGLEEKLKQADAEEDSQKKAKILEEVKNEPPLESGEIERPFINVKKEYWIDLNGSASEDAPKFLLDLKNQFPPGGDKEVEAEVFDDPANFSRKKIQLTIRSADFRENIDSLETIFERLGWLNKKEVENFFSEADKKHRARLSEVTFIINRKETAEKISQSPDQNQELADFISRRYMVIEEQVPLDPKTILVIRELQGTGVSYSDGKLYMSSGGPEGRIKNLLENPVLPVKDKAAIKEIFQRTYHYGYDVQSQSLVIRRAMDGGEREELLDCFTNEDDKRAIERLYHRSQELSLPGRIINELWSKLPLSSLSPQNLADLKRRYNDAKFYAEFSLIGAILERIPSSQSEVAAGQSVEVAEFSEAAREAIKDVEGLAFVVFSEKANNGWLTVKPSLTKKELDEVLKKEALRPYEETIRSLFAEVQEYKDGTAEKPVNLDAKTILAITKLNDDGIKYSGGKLVISGVSEGQIKKLLENKDIPDEDKKTIKGVFQQSQDTGKIFEHLRSVRKQWNEFLAKRGIRIENNKVVAGDVDDAKKADIERLNAWLTLKVFSTVLNFEIRAIEDEKVRNEKLASLRKGEIVPLPPKEIKEQETKPLDYLVYQYLWELSVSTDVTEARLLVIEEDVRKLANNEKQEIESRIKDKVPAEKLPELVAQYKRNFGSLLKIFEEQKAWSIQRQIEKKLQGINEE